MVEIENVRFSIFRLVIENLIFSGGALLPLFVAFQATNSPPAWGSLAPHTPSSLKHFYFSE